MKALTIRRVDPELARALERVRRARGTSLNDTVLSLLRAAVGLGPQPRSNGLRELAGTWTADDLEQFERATDIFEQVDDELWT